MLPVELLEPPVLVVGKVVVIKFLAVVAHGGTPSIKRASLKLQP